MIALSDIHKSYTTGASQLHVLKGINLTIDKKRNRGQVFNLFQISTINNSEDYFTLRHQNQYMKYGQAVDIRTFGLTN